MLYDLIFFKPSPKILLTAPLDIRNNICSNVNLNVPITVRRFRRVKPLFRCFIWPVAFGCAAAQLPRRASAYDVYQNRADQSSSPASRRSSFRVQQDDDVGGAGGLQQKGKYDRTTRYRVVSRVVAVVPSPNHRHHRQFAIVGRAKVDRGPARLSDLCKFGGRW